MDDLYCKQDKYLGKGNLKLLANIAGSLMVLQGFLVFFFLFYSFGIPFIAGFGAGQLFVAIPSIIGGFFVLEQKLYKISLLCAIISIFILVIPGLIATLLIIMSEDEFES